MTLKIQSLVELSSLVANAAGYNSYSSSAFAFKDLSEGYAGFVSGTIRSNSGIMTANFQHSHSQDSDAAWQTLLSTSLIKNTASNYAFETLTNRHKPLLPYGRVTFGLATEAGAGARFDSIIAKFFTEK